jgi:hypothetical protein
MAGPRCLEFASPERVQRLIAASNVKIVRKRKTGSIVEVHLLEFGDDFRLPASHANPQRLSHNHETEDNPARVWTLKKLVDVSAGQAPPRQLR